MAQIQIRDARGHGIPLMNIRISEGDQPSEAAIYDVFTDQAGNTGWPVPFWPPQRYALHVNVANVQPRFVAQSYYLLASDTGDVRIELAEVVPPMDVEALRRWPRLGMSIAGLLHNNRHNIREVVNIYQDCGVELTRINLLSAIGSTTTTPPFRLVPAGQKYDLYDWNPEFFDRLAEARDRMNGAGIVVQWTNYELYSWSQRKPGPQQINTPWRNNVNGVFWAPGDETLTKVLPDQWSKDWFAKVVPHLRLEVNLFEVGNEFPEKPLHKRVRDEVRKIQPNALVSVNRQEDTPGQYPNMKIGQDYNFIAFHGNRLKQVSDLSRKNGEHPTYQTFDDFFRLCPHDPKRIIFSSDGARISDDPVNTYDWGPLREFVKEVRRRGCSFEHQSRSKMSPAPNHSMIETDWFRSLR